MRKQLKKCYLEAGNAVTDAHLEALGQGKELSLAECENIMLDKLLTNGVTVLPCKIGDKVWTIRCYKGVLHPQEGTVNEMFFCDDMRLCIVVKHIARGEWGKTVFATAEEAQAAIRERMIHNA